MQKWFNIILCSAGVLAMCCTFWLFVVLNRPLWTSDMTDDTSDRDKTEIGSGKSHPPGFQVEGPKTAFEAGPYYTINWTHPEADALEVLTIAIRQLEAEQSTPRGTDERAKLIWDLNKVLQVYSGTFQTLEH